MLHPQILDEILTKFFAEVRKKYEKEYEPDSLHIMQASLHRRRSKLGSHNGVAITSVSFKNLAEHLGFRGQQDHNNAYFVDISILQMQMVAE